MAKWHSASMTQPSAPTIYGHKIHVSPQSIVILWIPYSKKLCTPICAFSPFTRRSIQICPYRARPLIIIFFIEWVESARPKNWIAYLTPTVLWPVPMKRIRFSNKGMSTREDIPRTRRSPWICGWCVLNNFTVPEADRLLAALCIVEVYPPQSVCTKDALLPPMRLSNISPDGTACHAPAELTSDVISLPSRTC